MTNREFEIKASKNKYEKCIFLHFISDTVEEPLQRYLNLKKNGDTDFHLDYLLKKEIVLNKDKKTLHILDLKEGDMKKGKDIPVYDGKEPSDKTIDNINEKIFNNNPPVNNYRNLCDTLNWINDSLYMDVQGSLIVGLGDNNVKETSMTIHHTYGIPYLPAQAIKGMFRNYFITEIIEDIKNPKLIKINNKAINSKELYEFIFGDIIGDDEKHKENLKGSVIFFDAFPHDKCTIAKDIMTPHYSSYYSGNGLPLDTENPVPIPFYIVKNTTFVLHYV